MSKEQIFIIFLGIIVFVIIAKLIKKGSFRVNIGEGGVNIGKAILTCCKWSYIPLIIGCIIFFIIVGYSNWPWWEPPPDNTGTESSYGQVQKMEERIESYGNRLVKVGPVWSAEYGAKNGGTMRIKRVDPSIPLEYLLTKLDDTKEIVDIPAVHEGYGDIKIPDYKRLRIKAPKETTVWIITKPFEES